MATGSFVPLSLLVELVGRLRSPLLESARVKLFVVGGVVLVVVVIVVVGLELEHAAFAKVVRLPPFVLAKEFTAVTVVLMLGGCG